MQGNDDGLKRTCLAMARCFLMFACSADATACFLMKLARAAC